MNPNVELAEPILYLLIENDLLSKQSEIVMEFSNHRTSEILQLTLSERRNMLSWLEKFKTPNERDKIINRLFHLCNLYGWNQYDDIKKELDVDIEPLNAWLIKYGTYHKELDQHNLQELSKVTNQFEKVVNEFLKTI